MEITDLNISWERLTVTQKSRELMCEVFVAVADADNDMVAFSSDDELMEAVRNVNDGILRVFITENPPPAPGPLHHGVVCDGCEGEIHGIRFKCSVCPDYDLCSVCKTTGLHGEHELRAITVPLPWGGVCSLLLTDCHLQRMMNCGCFLNLIITVLVKMVDILGGKCNKLCIFISILNRL